MHNRTTFRERHDITQSPRLASRLSIERCAGLGFIRFSAVEPELRLPPYPSQIHGGPGHTERQVTKSNDFVFEFEDTFHPRNHFVDFFILRLP